MNKLIEISNEEYAKAPGLRASFIKSMLRSPAHAREEALKPQRTAALDLGAAFHCAVLEPVEFRRRYYALPAGDGRTTAVIQARRKAKVEAAEGALGLLPESWSSITGMQAAVMAHPVASKLAVHPEGLNERSIFWESNGVQCKCRLDRITPYKDELVVVDFKSTRDSSAHGFGLSVEEFGYHIQQAWYQEGLKAAEIFTKRFFFVVVESAAPFDVNVYELDSGWIELALMEIERLVPLYAKCSKTNVWPGRSTGIATIPLPSRLAIKLTA